MTHTVLVIEDKENIRTVRFDLEHELDCALTICKTASDARKELSDKKFDLILVDVQIPDSVGGAVLPFGGLDVVETLHEGELGQLNTDTHYLILTAQKNSLFRAKVTKDRRCLGVVGKINQLKAIDLIGGTLCRKEGCWGGVEYSWLMALTTSIVIGFVKF